MKFHLLTRFIILNFGIALFNACGVPSEDLLVIKNISVLDMKTGKELSNTTLIIKDDKIVDMTNSDDLEFSDGTLIIDGTGKYLMPGMWDMHVHIQWSFTQDSLHLFLNKGITSVREMGSDPLFTKNLINKIENGTIQGPRIKFSGPTLESPEWIKYAVNESGNPNDEDFSKTRVVISNAREVESIVDSLKNIGVDFIKIRSYADTSIYFAIADAARKHGLSLAGHSPYGIDQMKVASSGQNSFEHGWYPTLRGLNDEEKQVIITGFAENKIAVVPTLSSWHPISLPLYRIEKVLAGDSLVPALKEMPIKLRNKWLNELNQRKKNGEQGNWKTSVLANQSKEVVMLYKHGIIVMPGTDTGGFYIFPGQSLHQELSFFVQGGMTPMEALQSATIVPANFMGLSDYLGSVEKGKLADIIILGQNPTDDIAYLNSIEMTIKNGEIVYEKQ